MSSKGKDTDRSVAKKQANKLGKPSPNHAEVETKENGKADTLKKELIQVLETVKRGDFTARMSAQQGAQDRRIVELLNDVVVRNEQLASELSRIRNTVGKKGEIDERASLPGLSGQWSECIEDVNGLVVDMGNPIHEMERVIGAVSRGDLSQKMNLDVDGEPVCGEFRRTSKIVNTMVDQLSSFAREVTRVAREVGTEGKLGGQARVEGVSGTWKDLTDNVNSMADNLTTQVRGIAEVTTAVANGDLSKKITVEAKGEIAELADTINRMVDQLSSFASEVTRVAREVGTEGKLGGQARVDGVSGTWKDLTDNVNSMANNLTMQVRGIAEVTTAVANGDLSKKITVDAQGEILELKDTINTMVDQLSSFASEVTRVAREVGTEGKLGGQARVEGVSGTWKDLTDNVNWMADNLTTQVRGIAEVTTAVANGDLSKKITVDARGEILELKDTINTMVDQLSSFAREVTRVAREVGTKGKLGGQAEVEGVSGTWKDLTDNVNSMANNLTTQVRGIADVTTAVANGDLSKKITVDAQGEILELKDTINTMVDQLSSFASEVTRVAREVGTEGKLGGQARVDGVSGTWKDLTDNVNSMANNLTMQVRGIAEVTTAVANGDLSKKITVDAQGEILELKDTINTMVDQLSSFASEVTRVAREVGTKGKLGGQAEVEGVSGTWKDLTDNVNAMANNLTTQVRGIATVVTAVAKGNLNRKLSVDAKGEIAELTDTINDMIDTLDTFADQVTTVAREVGVEGELGGQAEVPGASGTWRDLTDNVNQLAANLTTQVRAITEVTTAVAAGDLSKKITVDAAGEVAELKDNVNEMIRNLKETTRKNNEQDWLKTNLAKFTQLLQGQKDLKTVSKLVLSELAPLVNVQHGAFYIAEERAEDRPAGEGPTMKLLATYAYKKRRNLANRFEAGEGLVGQCALEKEQILLTDVPDDYIVINSGLGEAIPLNIVVMPVLFEGNVKAVIELASFQEFNDTHLNFLDQLTESIGIVLNTLEANMRTERLLEQSQSQQDQLAETNQQLEEKAQSLQESEEKLKQQQVELQQTNSELEDKAELLSEQKSEVERKNHEIEQARKELEEKAEQLALTSKYKSEFLANMSHELRTPLNSMLILSKMLAENREGNLTDKQIDYAETVHSSGADLLGLINEILDLSKIEAGSMGVEIADVAVEETVSDLESLFTGVAQEKGVEFRIQLNEDLPERMQTDQKRLQQVLKNLISNSLKFTEEGYVELEVLTAPSDMSFDKEVLQSSGCVIGFKVKDTGPGIPEEKQKVIFEAFQQAEGGADRDHGGTGLGLSISREIARLLGGELRLEKTNSEGSTFAFYLPSEYEPTDLAKDEGTVSEEGDGSVQDAQAGQMPSFNTENLFPEGPPATNGGEEEDVNEASSTPDHNSELGERVHEAKADKAEQATHPEVAQAPDSASEENDHDVAEEANAQSAQQQEEERQSQQHAAPTGDGAPKKQGRSTSKTSSEQVGSLDDDRGDIEQDDSVLMIVEDDPKFAKALLDIAHEQGFKVVVAPHGELAPQYARRYNPDAITLDVELPGMHGITLLDQLKNNPQTRHIPIAIISVVEELPRREKKGALTQLQKPITEEDVRNSLTQLKDFAGRDVKNLLVVEDEEVQRESIADHVRGEDVQITSVATGDEALEAFEAGTFDCVVIDLNLPDMDGIKLIEEIRTKLNMKDLPIVVHTARDLSEEETETLNKYVEAVILKGVESFNEVLSETTLFLHRQEQQLPEEKRKQLEQQSETNLAGRKVLIIDDDIRNIFAITSLLERHDMEVIYEEGGEDGIERLKEEGDKIDAVLMDIMMPGMDGYEATRKIRDLPRFKSLPIIAVTAKAMKGDREKCIEAGASDYITKPVNVEQLTSLLRVWINK